MRFDLYIFDLDGTLVDTLEIWNEISLAFLARFGIVPTEQEIRAMDTMTFQEGSDYLRGHFGLPLSAEGLSEAWMETATEIFDSRVQLMPGALETLHVLRGRGAKVVNSSQTSRRLVEGMLDRLGLARAVDAVLLAGETTFPKGDERAFAEIAQKFETPLSRTAAVDDSPYALEAAKRAGVYCCAMIYRNKHAKQAAAIADETVEALWSL